MIPAQKSGRGKVVNLTTLEKALLNSKEIIKELAQRILRDKLSEKDEKSESQKLATSALIQRESEILMLPII